MFFLEVWVFILMHFGLSFNFDALLYTWVSNSMRFHMFQFQFQSVFL